MHHCSPVVLLCSRHTSELFNCVILFLHVFLFKYMCLLLIHMFYFSYISSIITTCVLLLLHKLINLLLLNPFQDGGSVGAFHYDYTYYYISSFFTACVLVLLQIIHYYYIFSIIAIFDRL